MKDALRRVFILLQVTLREIFDENAYARFLVRESLPPSKAAYALFLQQHEAASHRKPRCC